MRVRSRIANTSVIKNSNNSINRKKLSVTPFAKSRKSHNLYFFRLCSRYLYDIKHKTAVLLKQYLQHNETWKQFIQLAFQTKSQVQQTVIAFMALPNQRTKAHYMNLEALVWWGQRALALLDHMEDPL